VTALLALLLTGALGGTAWLWRAGTPGASVAGSAVLQCPTAAPVPDAAHPGMVWVPGGNLAFGDTVYPEEQPVRSTPVGGFWMDRTEVRNDDFSAFVNATGYVTVAERPVDPALHPDLPPDMRQPGAVVFVMPNATDGSGRLTQWWRYVPGANWRHPGGPQTDIVGRGAFPVVAVTVEDAQAYARWKGHDLPTEAQWEWAARAGQAEKPDRDPPAAANTWQGLFPVANSGDDGFIGLAPTGCYPANAYGLFDMIGNVWEITADRWTPGHRSTPSGGFDPAPTPTRASATGQHVIKGGSYLCAPNYCMRYRAGARQPQDDDLGTSHLGFRTVLNAPGP
jgi:formylglycine-generating enzyme